MPKINEFQWRKKKICPDYSNSRKLGIVVILPKSYVTAALMTVAYSKLPLGNVPAYH